MRSDSRFRDPARLNVFPAIPASRACFRQRRDDRDIRIDGDVLHRVMRQVLRNLCAALPRTLHPVETMKQYRFARRLRNHSTFAQILHPKTQPAVQAHPTTFPDVPVTRRASASSVTRSQ